MESAHVVAWAAIEFQPRLDRRIGVEDRLPDGVVLLVAIEREADVVAALRDRGSEMSRRPWRRRPG